MAEKQTTPRFVQPYRYASPNIPLAAIRRFARRIAERFQPDKIILFGSYAYGKPHEESDVDLLVIVRTKYAIDPGMMASKRPKGSRSAPRGSNPLGMSRQPQSAAVVRLFPAAGEVS